MSAGSWRTASISDLLRRSRRRDDEATVERPPFTPTLPSVNLLPGAVRESIAMARIRRIGLLAGLVLVVVAGLVWASQIPAIQQAEGALASAQLANAREQVQIQALSPITQMLTQVTRQEALVKTTLADQPKAAVVYRHLLDAARRAGGSALQFSSMTMAYTGIPETGAKADGCPNPDPFSKQLAIGCVTFSASAASREQVSAFLVALARDPLFVGPYVNTSTLAGQATGARTSVAFSGTVGVSLAGLETKLTADQRKQLTAPAPAASPAPTTADQP